MSAPKCCLKILLSLSLQWILSVEVSGGLQVLDSELHHIRNGSEQEWTQFSKIPESATYKLNFQSQSNADEQTLRIVQHDVKQLWVIELNGHKLGRLHRDENAIVGYWTIPKQILIDGKNSLVVSTNSTTSDDIRIGEVAIEPKPLVKVLNQSRVSVVVRDEATHQPTPCRITVLENGRLMTLGSDSNDQMAIRPGVIYCKGVAEFSLPEGKYTIVAGRGPEYGIETRSVMTVAGETQSLDLSITREVSTIGYVACDTHVHTLTYSGHGDSTARERMLTLAGEGIELPIATDHNVHINYEKLAVELGVRDYFTPVIGNEVTTKVGHFNVFPIASTEVPIPNYKAEHWPEIFESIFATPNVKVAILNHSRDIHSNYRPFGPEHYLASTATNLDGWELRANAMEVINSAAQQSDMMQPVHDWMAQLNAGRRLTPVGCSDSHDVARHFVGQGRTYIRCDDTNPGQIDVDAAISSFVAGRVSIGCGLFAEIHINDKAGPGDIVPRSKKYHAHVDVHGPSWATATEVELFINGVSFQTFQLKPAEQNHPGLKASFITNLPISSSQDAFVVAVARGPGVTDLFWPIAKPYQPTSPDWTPTCMAVTGAVWIDADGDGMLTSAKKYANAVCTTANHDPKLACELLGAFDTPVATHVAHQLMTHHENSFVSKVLPIARQQGPVIQLAFEMFYEEWQKSQRARAGAATSPD